MNEQAKNEVETLLGREIAVSYDGPASGPFDAPATVTVHKVALRNMARYAGVISQDEAQEIALYTRRSPDWAELLSEESIDAILTTGRELNAKRFANFVQRVTKFDQQIRQAAPALGQLADKAQAAMIASRSGGVSST